MWSSYEHDLYSTIASTPQELRAQFVVLLLRMIIVCLQPGAGKIDYIGAVAMAMLQGLYETLSCSCAISMCKRVGVVPTTLFTGATTSTTSDRPTRAGLQLLSSECQPFI